MLFTLCVSFQPTLNLPHGKPCNAASYPSLESPGVEDQGEEEEKDGGGGGGGGGGGRRRKEEEGEEPLTAFPKAPLASANSDDSAPWFAIIIAN